MKQVLVIEDEPLVREHILLQLKKIDPAFEVIKFKSVDEFENALNSISGIDLAILDINLGSGRSGIDAAKIIRMKFSSRLIFLTAFSDEQTLSKIACVDPDAYITKPFVEAQFQATVRTVLTRKSVNPEKLLSGNMLSIEDLFRILNGCVNEIERSDKVGIFASAIEYFKVSEKIFFKFKESQLQDDFGELINKLWLSSLKFQKIAHNESIGLIQQYVDTVALTLAHLKTVALKLYG